MFVRLTQVCVKDRENILKVRAILAAVVSLLQVGLYVLPVHAESTAPPTEFYKYGAAPSASAADTKSGEKRPAKGRRASSEEESPSWWSQSDAGACGQLKHPLPGMIRRTRGVGGGHDGIDMAAPRGTPVYSASRGVVIAVGKPSGFSGYDRIVLISCGGGQILYAHIQNPTVRPGDRVSVGEKIASIGPTGPESSGEHVHVEGRRIRLPF